MKILVLGGGNSPEREVSLRSAKAVAEAARNAGFDVLEKDPAYGLQFLDALESDTIVFPILHGAGGEDGSIQTELENRKIPYLGANPQSSLNCFDKAVTRSILLKAGIPIAKGAVVTKSDYPRHPLARTPHVLKVVKGGSSIGTLISREGKPVPEEEINRLFNLGEQAILEELVEGIEITVAILDNKALMPVEIIPPENSEFDYENKYNGKTQEICPPPSVAASAQQKNMDLAERVHKAMKCRHLSRIDIIIPNSGPAVVLEINTMPGLTDQSLYPKSATFEGIPMPKLVVRFADMVIRDYKL